jgi:hypothetical protein
MTDFLDSPAALNFVVSQRSHIEPEVLKRPYPQIKYSRLIPVDTSANPFALSVTHFTQDSTGRAKFINGKGDDIPMVNITGSKFESTVNMAGVGYSFSLEEIGAAQMMGRNLSNDGAAAARLAYEQFVDAVAFIGDTTLGVEGFYNMTGITTAAAGTTFAASTPDQVLAIINNAIAAIETASLGVEIADTIILPLKASASMERRLGDGSDTTILDFIARANRYTRQTGQPLTIEFDWRLDATNRMVVYRRDPEVLKMHMPMPLRFIPPQAVNLEIKVLGMFRFAPVNIRRPVAVRYISGVTV